jgi:hypothetical protein
MKLKTKIIIAVVTVAGVFALGRYTAPSVIVTEIKTVVVEKVVYTQTRSKTTIDKKPDGSETTVIISDTNTQDHTNSTSTDTTKETPVSKTKVNVTALVGSSFAITNPADALVSTRVLPIYGLSVTAPVFGPVTLTGFGLSNLIFGGGVGLNF